MIFVNYKGEEKQFDTEEISSMVLIKIREIAEAIASCHCKEYCCHYSSLLQRLSVSSQKGRWCVIAGLNVMRIINEPTAAAIAYGLDKKVTVLERRTS